jgi:molybdopterin/thiamine biosynthesis adenylyltransferase
MHVFQVGAGSGGIVVLDLLARDSRVTQVTLVESDTYKTHNVYRHAFPPSAIGRLKAELAAEWVKERRPEITVKTLVADLTDPAMLPTFEQYVTDCRVGVCAVDNEPAKYAFDALMRKAGKPWVLGEVLSGGIGGWVHRFAPDGPCYGCVASHLQRTVTEAPQGPAPDYANPGGPIEETTVPASKASIEVIAGLHAVVTLEMIEGMVKPDRQRGDVPGTRPPPDGCGSRDPDFTSLLFTLRRVPGVFEDAFRSYRFRVEKSAACLICSAIPVPATGEALDVALDQALARLGND